jgi:hypothetical protein
MPFLVFRNNVGALLGSPKKESWTDIRQDLEVNTDVSYFLHASVLTVLGFTFITIIYKLANINCYGL